MWTVCLALLILCLVGIALVQRSWTKTKLIARELERIRSADEPVTSAELTEMYEAMPYDPETTATWEEGFQLLRAVPLTLSDVDLLYAFIADSAPLDGTPWPSLEAAEEHLEKRKEARTLLHEAARSEAPVRYALDLRRLPISIEHIADVRAAARLLALEADVRAYKGNVRESAHSILAILSLSRTLESEPITISLYIRIASDLMAMEQIARLLPILAFSDEELRQFQVGLRRSTYKPHLRLTFLGGRVGCIRRLQEWIDHPFTLPPPSPPPGGGRFFDLSRAKQLTNWKLRAEDEFLLYLDLMARLVTITGESWPVLIREARVIQEETETDEVRRFQVTPSWIASTAESSLHVAQSVARRRAAEAAIAVERFRRHHGEYPKRLYQLVPDFLPEVPEDPFTGEPLRYLIEENGYVVYSVGPDGVDDGGKSDDSRGPDLVFRVSRPPAD